MRPFLVAVACTIVACSPSVRPAPPADTSSAPPVPALEAPLSRFNVPLSYDFSPILRIVEHAVPMKFGSIDSVHQVGDDPHRHFAFEATREPFGAFIEGRIVHLRATVKYKVRGFYKPPIGPTLSAGCGGDDKAPRLTLELVTPLTLTPSWHLASRAAIASIGPASSGDRDRCKMSILQRDVTDRVVSSARDALAGHLRDIDRTVGRVDLHKRFAEWWSLLERPIRVSDGVWLVLAPEQLRMGKVSGTGTVLTVQAGLDAHPRIVTTVDTPAVRHTTLPPLARDTVSEGFRILLDGVLDYETATRAMTTALRGRTVTNAGQTVAVDSVSVTPAPNHKLALTVSFTGAARGRVRFIGVPQYNRAAHQVSVPDLDYDLETSNQLVNAYAWLRSDALRTLFRERARVPDGPALDKARSLLLSALNRKIGSVMTLSATVDSLSVAGLYVTPSALVLRGEARGRAAVDVRQR